MPGADASRLVGMEDMLHMPQCNTTRCVKEAKKKQIRGVVHLVSGELHAGGPGLLIHQEEHRGRRRPRTGTVRGHQ
jgi:hypothetical protein